MAISLTENVFQMTPLFLEGFESGPVTIVVQAILSTLDDIGLPISLKHHCRWLADPSSMGHVLGQKDSWWPVQIKVDSHLLVQLCTFWFYPKRSPRVSIVTKDKVIPSFIHETVFNTTQPWSKLPLNSISFDGIVSVCMNKKLVLNTLQSLNILTTMVIYQDKTSTYLCKTEFSMVPLHSFKAIMFLNPNIWQACSNLFRLL